MWPGRNTRRGCITPAVHPAGHGIFLRDTSLQHAGPPRTEAVPCLRNPRRPGAKVRPSTHVPDGEAQVMSNDLPTGPVRPETDLPVQPDTVPLPAPDPLRMWADDGAGGGQDWRRYLTALVRYKWLILLVLALGTAAGIVVSRFVPVRYTAQSTVWIETGSRRNEPGPILTGGLLQSYSWLELLRSYVVLDHVVREMRLYLRPSSPAAASALRNFTVRERFQPGTYEFVVGRDGNTFELLSGSGEVLQRGMFGDSVGADLGFQWVPTRGSMAPGERIAFTVTNLRDAARWLNENLDARMMTQQGNFLRIGLTGTDPWQTAATVNAVARRLVEVAAELKRARLDELTKILEEQLRVARENLEAAEMALEAFRIQTITLPSDRGLAVAPGVAVTQNPAYSQYFDMKFQQEQLQRDHDAIQRALAAANGSALSVEALEVIPSVQQSSQLKAALAELTGKRAELRSLRHRYTDEHPHVKQVIAQVDSLEQTVIPRLATALLSELRTRRSELDRLIDASSAQLRQIPPRMIEEARLQRHVATAEALYTDLHQRYNEARLAAESSIPDLSILDEAVVPQRPASNRRPQIILMAFAGSLGLAILGAILLDRIDPRVRYPEQVTHDLGLPILGAVPHVHQRKPRPDSDEAAAVVEAFRTIRLNLMHAYGTAGPVMVTVSSPGSGDGKSFTSANLALAFAELGRRTLLIDGDIRRGALHRLFGLTRKPGLIDYLRGGVEWEALIQRTEHKSLDFIGCGTRLQSGPELLASGPMGSLLKELRSRYDVILVDSPPLAAGIDPFVLGTLTGNMLLVLRTGRTDREMAGAKLDLLQRLPVRILGAVLNDVSASGLYRYYYRHYAYLPGYQAEDEEPAGAGNLVKA